MMPAMASLRRPLTSSGEPVRSVDPSADRKAVRTASSTASRSPALVPKWCTTSDGETRALAATLRIDVAATPLRAKSSSAASRMRALAVKSPGCTGTARTYRYLCIRAGPGQRAAHQPRCVGSATAGRSVHDLDHRTDALHLVRLHDDRGRAPAPQRAPRRGVPDLR